MKRKLLRFGMVYSFSVLVLAVVVVIAMFMIDILGGFSVVHNDFTYWLRDILDYVLLVLMAPIVIIWVLLLVVPNGGKNN